MPRLVILSSDRNVDDSFFVPGSFLLWRRCGFEPIVFLVGTVEDWLNAAPSRETLATAREAGKYDEQLFGDRIRRWTGYPHRCRMIDRTGALPSDRIDRSAWPVGPDPRGMIDAHLPRPGFGSWWPWLRHLFGQLLPERGAWADAYRERFREALQAGSVD